MTRSRNALADQGATIEAQEGDDPALEWEDVPTKPEAPLTMRELVFGIGYGGSNDNG